MARLGKCSLPIQNQMLIEGPFLLGRLLHRFYMFEGQIGNFFHACLIISIKTEEQFPHHIEVKWGGLCCRDLHFWLTTVCQKKHVEDA